MSTTKAISVASLGRAAEEYDKVLRVMPFDALEPKLAELGIGFSEATETVQKQTTRERKGGLSRPYVAGDDYEAGEIGKMIDRELKIELSVLPIVDNITNYRDKKVVGAKAFDNKTKNHPLEVIIMQAVLETASEDILDALFHGKRDTSDKTPIGMFNGYGTIIADEIAAGNIAVAKGNLVNTGAFDTTPDDSTAAKANMAIITDFLRKADRFLQKRGVLKMTQPVYFALMDSLEVLNSNIKNPTMEDLLNYLRNKAGIPTLSMKMDPIMGTGHNLIYDVPFNMEFSMRGRKDAQFVQPRTPFTDANLIQYWTQWEAGAQIWNLHKKEFMTNAETWESTPLSGDYRS